MSVEVPVLPETAPFSADQRLWLNGFLAGYFARQTLPSYGAGSPSAPAPGIPVRILFGSQTGTAELVAKRLAKEVAAAGCQAVVTDAAEHGKIDWSKESHLLIVTSTYGDGDMPDNAQGFWDWLRTDAAATLAHLHFAVLALGDRNYANFCAAGKNFDDRLAQLGASRIFNRTDCDLEYEAAVKGWTEGVLAALTATAASPGNGAAVQNGHSHLGAPGKSTRPTVGHLNGNDNGSGATRAAYSKSHPFPARLLRNICLSKPGSVKEVRHYELCLEGSGLSYEPGDALGVFPVNCPELVSDILSAVHATGGEQASVEGAVVPATEALARHLDVSKPSRELVNAVAQRSPGSQLSALLAPERQPKLRDWLWGRGVIDLLHLLPEALTWAELLPLLKKLTPRLYSISSSMKAHPAEVHLTVSSVRYECHGRRRKGVASTFLADRIGEADYVKIFRQPSHGFKLPPDSATPIIMVGPGTGIAPFRAFLEERHASGSKGRHWLFFGDQRRETDFLYEEQLVGWRASGHLTRLDLAFSRDQADKVYVQHRMLEAASELWAWLEEGAQFYVCGDAARMAKDVDATLHQIAQTAGGKTADDAKAWIAKLKTDRRYQRDVY